jgi:hypothetical protein
LEEAFIKHLNSLKLPLWSVGVIVPVSKPLKSNVYALPLGVAGGT